MVVLKFMNFMEDRLINATLNRREGALSGKWHSRSGQMCY